MHLKGMVRKGRKGYGGKKRNWNRRIRLALIPRGGGQKGRRMMVVSGSECRYQE